MIFSTKNNQLAIFGNTIDDVRKKIINLSATYEQYGLTGKKGIFASLFGSNRPQIIPEANLTKVLSFDEASKQLEDFNRRVVQGGMSLDTYFKQYQNGNTVLRNYVTTTEQQSQSTQGLIKASEDARAAQIAHNKAIKNSTLSAKAGSVALKALSIAGNMLAAWAISKIISIVATNIERFGNASKHAAENAKALASEMNKSISSISSNSSTLSDLNDEYQKLSKGVNKLGENVSLSTDDYSRYKEIISQVSSIMPNMTTYFNAQGEKIAFARGELQDLNKEYEEYIKKQARDYIANGDGDGNTIQDILNSYNSNKEFTGFEKYWNKLKNAYGYINPENFTTEDIIDELEKFKDRDHIQNSIGKLNSYFLNFLTPYRIIFNAPKRYDQDTALKRMIIDQLGLSGKTQDDIVNMTETEYNALMQKINACIQKYNTKIASDMNQVNTALIEVAYNSDLYWKNDQDTKNDVIAFLSSINSDVWDELQKNTDTEMIGFVNNIITFMSKNTNGFADAWNGLFSPKLDDLPVNEYAQQIDSFLKTICNVLGLDETNGVHNLKFSLGFDNVYDTNKRLQNAVRALADDHGIAIHEIVNSDEYAELLEIVNNLTLSEAELCLDAINDAENVTDALNGVKKVLESISDADEPPTLSTQLTNSTDSLDKFQSSVKSAADAYATLLSGNYSSSELLDSIQAINKAASDMGKSIDWESIAASDNPLQAIQDEIESVSNTYAESVLSGTGIEDSDFGKMLANIVQQAYEVEAEFAGMNAQLDRLQSSYKTLTDVLESYNETGHISLDNLQSLLTADENLITMLEVENGKLAINQEAYENLVAVQLMEFKEKLNNAAAAEIETLAKKKAEKATGKNAKASEDAVAKIDAETEAFGRNTSAAIANAMAKAEEEGVSEEEIKSVLDKYAEIWNAAMDNYGTDFPTFMNGAKSSGEAAGKSAGEAFTDTLDKELTALDKKMEAGYIDFKDYIQVRLDLIENYYKQGKLSADEYYSYLENHYKQELSYRDKAVSAVTRRIDAELDALKQQKDDVESIYKTQIESLEKEKTLLEEANKERQRQIDLQKSLYDLERARNQRTKLVYSEDKGMHYVADDQSIRSAQQEVDNARYDIKIAGIDKSISNLEEIRNTKTNAIDEMISDLEAYKEAWSDITSAYEEEQENLIAAQILGADWETDILNGRLDVLDDFKNEYISTQQAMADAAWKYANEQIKAAKEAEYTIKVNVDTNGEIPDVNDTSTPEEGTITLPDGRMLTPYDPDRDTSGFGKLYKAWNAYYRDINKNVEEIQKTLSHHVMMEHNQQMQEEVNRFLNNSGSVVNNKNVQPVVNQEFNISMPNVTNSTSAETLMRDLQSLATKKYQIDW